jgi:small subunit ribosomal protein S4
VNRRFGVAVMAASKKESHRNYPPGQHGPKSARRKTTDYGLGLLEKQKLRFYYGLLERQFRRVYEKAVGQRGVTGETMLRILETRLDSVVYSLGLAATRPAARQLINHGHVKVNGRKVGVASYAARPGDVVEVRDSNVSRQLALRGVELSTSRAVPGWLTFDRDALRGTVVRLPAREDIHPIANEQTVVEFYSR